MKKTRSGYFLTKKFYYLPLILLGAVSFGPGCQKSKQANPCEGVLSEAPPTQLGLLLKDAQTGENILLSKNIDAATITITQEGTTNPSEQGVIVKTLGAPTYGALVFHITDTKKGVFRYKITIPGVGSTTLSYTNKEEKSDNVCNPYYIRVTDPVIEGHPFTAAQVSSRWLVTVTL